MEKLERKRQRGKNFTHDEEMLLLELVKTEKNVLENRKSDAKTWKQKEETWEKLTKQFVSQIGINRTARTLRDKYESLKRNMKRRSTAEVADEKRETYHTVQTRCVSPVSEKIFALLGESTGLSKIFDSDFSVSNDCSTSNEHSDHETSSFTNADDVQETHEESEATNCWHPAKLTEMKSTKVNIGNNNKINCSLEQEKLFLTRLQQDFYRNENIRAEEKHVEEQKLLHLKNELLEQQQDFYRNENIRAEEKHTEERKSLRLKNELLELEILEKKRKLINTSESENEHKLQTL